MGTQVLQTLPSCIALAFVPSIQAEQTKCRNAREEHHAKAHNYGARNSVTDLVAEFAVHVADLHPLQRRLPEFGKQ